MEHASASSYLEEHLVSCLAENLQAWSSTQASGNVRVRGQVRPSSLGSGLLGGWPVGLPCGSGLGDPLGCLKDLRVEAAASEYEVSLCATGCD